MNVSPFQMAVVVVAGALVACSKTSAPAPAPAVETKPVATAAVVAELGGDGKLDPKDPNHGKRKMMGLDAPVFVDGVEAAVLRYGDLPQIPVETLEGGSHQYRIYDYLKAVGIAPESIKSIHFHGNGDRIASIEGAELLKDKARFNFKFSSRDTGAPVQRWDTDGLKNEFVVHEIRKVSVFVKKAPAPISTAHNCHVGADGQCTDAVPYAEGEPAKGTRVYVDGKMVGFVKRRLVGETMIAGDLPDGEHKFSVAKLLSSMNVDVASASGVELVAGDDVVGRADAGQWSKLASQLTFTLPKHQHGKVRVHVPTELQSTAGSEHIDRDAFVSSVLVYKNTKPANHELTTISEDTDMSVQLASNTAREAQKD